MEANPLVEENKNQIAVMRGPIVYCLENVDIDASSVPKLLQKISMVG
ncbi:glycoside hydrolase family 127 protein [Segatella copri]|uniref:Glycoside hydrolase family 127 protein n=1 Tax=Segatella copri TaxID=165179 RepID=A0AAW5TZB7_9BACT|nr:glycoside hydrolase family 127 protein [Segatella copri]